MARRWVGSQPIESLCHDDSCGVRRGHRPRGGAFLVGKTSTTAPTATDTSAPSETPNDSTTTSPTPEPATASSTEADGSARAGGRSPPQHAHNRAICGRTRNLRAGRSTALHNQPEQAYLGGWSPAHCAPLMVTNRGGRGGADGAELHELCGLVRALWRSTFRRPSAVSANRERLLSNLHPRRHLAATNWRRSAIPRKRPRRARRQAEGPRRRIRWPT